MTCRVKYWVLQLLCCASFATVTGVTAAAPGKVAVLVGVEQYQHIASLDYAVDDMVLLGRELETLGYEVVTLLAGEGAGQSTSDTALPLTSAAILTYLDELQNQLDAPGSTLLFAFSGHGFGDALGYNYLAMPETESTDLSNTALNLQHLQSKLIATGAENKILLLDACRNRAGEDDRFVAGAHPAPLLLNGGAMAIMYSASQHDYSWEVDRHEIVQSGLTMLDSDSAGHGLFSYFLIDGLRGAAVNPDGGIRFDTLFKHVHQQTRQWSQRYKPLVQIPRSTLLESTGGILIGTVPEADRVGYIVDFTAMKQADSVSLWGWLVGAIGLLLLMGLGVVYLRNRQQHVSVTVGFLCRSSDGKKLLTLPLQHVLSLGRGDDNDFQIHDSAISERHLRLGWDSVRRQFWIEDSGSANGTYIDNLPVPSHKRCYIETGKAFHLAKVGQGYCFTLGPG